MPTSDPTSIQLLILDVDGVLTDGTIAYSVEQGREPVETKAFNVRDGMGLRVWHELGYKAAIITGRGGPALEHRARELKIDHVEQNAKPKPAALDRVLAAAGVAPEHAAYLGDDWNDLPVMSRVGYPMAVADAAEEVIDAAEYVTALPGGRGAVREAIEHILREKGELEKAIELVQ